MDENVISDAAAKFYVYEHWRPDLGRCFYVGKGSGARAYIVNRGSYNDGYRAILSALDAKGLFAEIKMVKGGLTEGAAFNLEQRRIRFWKKRGVTLTNQTSGGSGPWARRHTEETRKKISVANKGRVVPPEQRQKIREKRLGSTASAETKARMSAAHLRRSTPYITGNPKGSKRSEETKRRMSESLKGRIVSDETRAKLAEIAKIQAQERGENGRFRTSVSPS